MLTLLPLGAMQKALPPTAVISAALSMHIPTSPSFIESMGKEFFFSHRSSNRQEKLLSSYCSYAHAKMDA
jgi:hypothetical protein